MTHIAFFLYFLKIICSTKILKLVKVERDSEEHFSKSSFVFSRTNYLKVYTTFWKFNKTSYSQDNLYIFL